MSDTESRTETLVVTPHFRWYRPAGGSDNDLRLQQLFQGSRGPVWLDVPVVLED